MTAGQGYTFRLGGGMSDALLASTGPLKWSSFEGADEYTLGDPQDWVVTPGWLAKAY